MSRRRLVLLLVAALIAIAASLYLSSQRNLPRDLEGSLLLPTLASQLNSVTQLSVRKGAVAPTVTVHKQGEMWTVLERGDYPADVPKLRKLLLTLSEAKIREEKTSNPTSYPAIGVEDPSLPNATGAEIELSAHDGKHGVIVGKPMGTGSFVRRAGETVSFTVEPAISFEAEPRYWLEARLLDSSADKIQSVEVKAATGPAYSLHRAAAPSGAPSAPKGTTAAPPAGAPPATAEFTLTGVPSGRKTADSRTLAPPASTLSALTIDDVAAAAAVDFSKPAVATFTMADGDVLTFTGAEVGDKRWVQVASNKDAALNTRAHGRAFEIASYRYDELFRPLEQLLIPKEPPAAAKKPSASPRP
jgi:Domain of unknown function (DUF4340)